MANPLLKALIPFFMEKAAPPPTPATHSFTVTAGGTSNSVGYNRPGGWGSISDADFDSPDGTTITIQQIRRLRNSQVILVMTGSGVTASSISEFPLTIIGTNGASRITVTRPSSLRSISSGIRADYTDISGNRLSDVFVNGATISFEFRYS